MNLNFGCSLSHNVEKSSNIFSLFAVLIGKKKVNSTIINSMFHLIMISNLNSSHSDGIPAIIYKISYTLVWLFAKYEYGFFIR